MTQSLGFSLEVLEVAYQLYPASGQGCTTLLDLMAH
jgi:hypothetical protein